MEVRFRDLDVRATAEAAGRALPSIWNAYRNTFEVQPTGHSLRFASGSDEQAIELGSRDNYAAGTIVGASAQRLMAGMDGHHLICRSTERRGRSAVWSVRGRRLS